MTDDAIAVMADSCVMMRTRLVARVLTGIYDDALRPHAIGAAQFSMLLVISKLAPASRAEIGRFHRQDKSTLTRNLKLLLAAGWVEEEEAVGRTRPIVLTKAGKMLLRKAAPAWRTAQTESEALLGREGVVAMKDVAGKILQGAAS